MEYLLYFNLYVLGSSQNGGCFGQIYIMTMTYWHTELPIQYRQYLSESIKWKLIKILKTGTSFQDAFSCGLEMSIKSSNTINLQILLSCVPAVVCSGVRRCLSQWEKMTLWANLFHRELNVVLRSNCVLRIKLYSLCGDRHMLRCSSSPRD